MALGEALRPAKRVFQSEAGQAMFSRAVAVIMLAIIVSFVTTFGWDGASVLVLIPAMAALTAILLGEA